MPADPTLPKPISLSDEALSFLMRIVEPLHPHDRSAFLKTLAHRLHGEEIGDGTIYRVARDVLRSGFFKPPKVSIDPAPKMLRRDAAPIFDD